MGVIIESSTTPVKCAFIITATQMGSAVLTMPGVVYELGWISFPMTLLFTSSLNMYCTMLAIFAFDKVLKERKVPHDDDELQRQPMQVYCRHAFGNNSLLTTSVTILQTLAHLSVGILMILVSSVTLQTLIKLPLDISTANGIRIWMVVVFFVLLPPSMISSFRELGHIGFLATSAIVLAVLVIILSSIYIAVLPITVDEQSVDTARKKQVWRDYNSIQIVFSSLGTINLAFAGFMISSPNLSVILLDTNSLLKATFYSNVSVFIIYLIAGWVPYFLLQQFVIDASVVTTILRISNEYGGGYLLNIMKNLIAMFIIMHFLLAYSVNLNPIHLRAEKMFKIANEFSFKRFALRGSILLGLTIFTLIFPMFSELISWLGGGVLMVYSTIVPIALYFNICESTIWTKCFGSFCVLVSLVLVFGINIVEFINFF